MWYHRRAEGKLAVVDCESRSQIEQPKKMLVLGDLGMGFHNEPEFFIAPFKYGHHTFDKIHTCRHKTIGFCCGISD